MDDPVPSFSLRDTWHAMLKRRKHDIVVDPDHRVLHSQDDQHRRFRWLLFTSFGRMRRLSSAERTWIRRHDRWATRCEENAYLVIHVMEDPPRLVVLPARHAFPPNTLDLTRGGIPFPGT